MVDTKNIPRAIGADYTVWHEDSKITLTNVPWDNNYRDIVKFADQRALNKWIDDRAARNVDIVGSRHYRINEPIRIEIPFTEAYGYNYVRVLNPAQVNVGNAAMWSYYFIIGIENTNPAVTTITVQLDIWQTFGHLMQFGNSYIQQGHIGIANSKSFDDYGRQYLTIPEGLDTGSDLQIAETRPGPTLFDQNNLMVMVLSSTNLEIEPGTVKNPTLQTATGSRILGMPSGASYYFFRNTDDFNRFINDYSKYPWLLQGIQSIVAVPNLLNRGYKFDTVNFPKSATKAYKLNLNFGDEWIRGEYRNTWPDWRDKVLQFMPARYRHLKKFLTFPYMAIEVTYYNGSNVVLKPEQWQHKDGAMSQKVNFVVPGERAVIYPRRYNVDPDHPYQQYKRQDGTVEYYQDGGEDIQMSATVSNFPRFAIVANAGTLALAGQAHSLAQQYKSMDWSQQKALGSNQTSYDQATAATNNMQDQAMIQRNAAIDTNDIANQQAVMRSIVSGASGLVNGALGGAMGGGGGGAVAGAAVGAATNAVNTGLDNAQRNANLRVSNQANVDSTGLNAQTSNYMRDTNKSLSDWAARGDYQQSVAALQAKVYDTAMTPPFTAGQAGGDVYNIVSDTTGYSATLIWRMVPPAEMRAIGEYWLRYGYAVRQFAKMPASLMVMDRFTYWKLSETYISSANAPEFIKQAVRGMFEKGVTVWASPDYIGNIDLADNRPLNGVSL